MRVMQREITRKDEWEQAAFAVDIGSAAGLIVQAVQAMPVADELACRIL